MQKVAVVIPIYKESLNENEIISLKRTQLILGEFPIIVLHPFGLNLEKYQAILPNVQYLGLEKSNFEGIKAYNRMLLSPAFYKLFLNYEYILICQTDVYIFSNDLLYWCEQNYDYLGSPWIIPPPQVKEKVIIDLNRFAVGKVGNGGLSLRRTNIFYKLSKITEWIFKFFPKNEDFIWCVIIPKIYPFLKFPKVDEALRFALELEPSKTYQRIGKLPFGVHAWEKYEPDFWKKFM